MKLKPFSKWLSQVGLILLVLIISVLLALRVGSTSIPWAKQYALFSGQSDPILKSIMFNVRIPRILLGIAVGGALGLAGVLLQGLFRNPLVEPYTLGISGGASIGVCLAILFRQSQSWLLSLPLAGLLGSLAVIVLLYGLTWRKSYLNPQNLLLTGVMLSFICSSGVMLIMAISKTEDLHGIVFWIMGSLEQPEPFLIWFMLGTSGLGLLISYFFCSALNALSLGEEEALHLGINVPRVRQALFLLASILAGFSVAVTGVIGFVGLVIPHFVRLLFGMDHRIILIAAYLTGAAFLILCDTLARTIIAPLELPVGVITGLIGGILFVYALSQKEIST